MRFTPNGISLLLLSLLPLSMLSGCSSSAYNMEQVVNDIDQIGKDIDQPINLYVDDYRVVQAIRDYAYKVTTSSQRRQMKALVEADIQRRINEGYTNVRIYKENKYRISDIMIINERGDKGLFFITHLMTENDDGIVKMFTGRKKPHQNTWEFSDGGIPSYYYAFKEVDPNAPPFTERMLIDRTLEKLANDGLVNSRNKIDQDYLNSHWF